MSGLFVGDGGGGVQIVGVDVDVEAHHGRSGCKSSWYRRPGRSSAGLMSGLEFES
jgi:hypothetical protein